MPGDGENRELINTVRALNEAYETCRRRYLQSMRVRDHKSASDCLAMIQIITEQMERAAARITPHELIAEEPDEEARMRSSHRQAWEMMANYLSQEDEPWLSVRRSREAANARRVAEEMVEAADREMRDRVYELNRWPGRAITFPIQYTGSTRSVTFSETRSTAVDLQETRINPDLDLKDSENKEIIMAIKLSVPFEEIINSRLAEKGKKIIFIRNAASNELIIRGFHPQYPTKEVRISQIDLFNCSSPAKILEVIEKKINLLFSEDNKRQKSRRIILEKKDVDECNS